MYGNVQLAEFLPTIEITSEETDFNAGQITIDFKYSANTESIEVYIDDILDDTLTPPTTSFSQTYEEGVYNITIFVITEANTNNSDSIVINVNENTDTSSVEQIITTDTSSIKTTKVTTTEEPPPLQSTPLFIEIILGSMFFLVLITKREKK